MSSYKLIHIEWMKRIKYNNVYNLIYLTQVTYFHFNLFWKKIICIEVFKNKAHIKNNIV